MSQPESGFPGTLPMIRPFPLAALATGLSRAFAAVCQAAPVTVRDSDGPRGWGSGA